MKEKETIEKITQFTENLISLQPRITLVSPENLHFTIKFLGEISESLVKNIYYIIEKEINEKLFKENALQYTLKGAGQFRNYSIIWIDILGEIDFLRLVQNTTEELLYSKLQVKKEKRSKFKPHLTVARLRNNRIDYKNLKPFKDLINDNKNREFGSFLIEKVTLKKSVLTPKGPIYSNLTF